jgi:hypothetical protein
MKEHVSRISDQSKYDTQVRVSDTKPLLHSTHTPTSVLEMLGSSASVLCLELFMNISVGGLVVAR